uniref:E3 ubiquitin-protein ligase MPSR1-like n=1 Tax=Erigeron canadensis TaxID=72917 RepID=UPI001CB8AE60|nr:E3 ubiquitin-protein ligase MPSR1-like [Erigeron canadensis]
MSSTLAIILLNMPNNIITSIFEQAAAKEGPLPASKASIESLQTVKVSQEEECAICMMEYDGESLLAKEMPCKHKFHADCVNKWLGIRGSCPVCRFEMPVDEEEEEKRQEIQLQLLFLDITSGGVSGSGLENGLASDLDMDSHQEMNQDNYGMDD